MIAFWAGSHHEVMTLAVGDTRRRVELRVPRFATPI